MAASDLSSLTVVPIWKQQSRLGQSAGMLRPRVESERRPLSRSLVLDSYRTHVRQSSFVFLLCLSVSDVREIALESESIWALLDAMFHAGMVADIKILLFVCFVWCIWWCPRRGQSPWTLSNMSQPTHTYMASTPSFIHIYIQSSITTHYRPYISVIKSLLERENLGGLEPSVFVTIAVLTGKVSFSWPVSDVYHWSDRIYRY